MPFLTVRPSTRWQHWSREGCPVCQLYSRMSHKTILLNNKGRVLHSDHPKASLILTFCLTSTECLTQHSSLFSGSWVPLPLPHLNNGRRNFHGKIYWLDKGNSHFRSQGTLFKRYHKILDGNSLMNYQNWARWILLPAWQCDLPKWGSFGKVNPQTLWCI